MNEPDDFGLIAILFWFSWGAFFMWAFMTWA